MEKHTWLEFENDDMLNAFMRSIVPAWIDHYSTTGDSRVGGAFTKEQIALAINKFGARVIDNSL